MNRKIFAVGAMMVLLVGLVAYHAVTVSARENESSDFRPSTTMMGDKRPDMPPPGMMQGKPEDIEKGGQPSFGIKPSGEVIVQSGKVTASSAGSLTVTVMGFSIPVTIGGDANSSSTINVGDVVSIRGLINASSGVITAKEIRNESTNQKEIEGIKAKIQSLMDQLKKLLGGNK